MKKPHALVVAFPAQGHIGPLMELCISLAMTGGFRITVANHPDNHSAIRQLEPLLHSRHPGAGAGADIHLIEIPPNHFPSSHDLGRYSVISQMCLSLRDLAT